MPNFFDKIPTSAKDIQALKTLGSVESKSDDNVVIVEAHNPVKIGSKQTLIKKQLWVRPSYKRYREAWEDEIGSIRAPIKMTSGTRSGSECRFDVDHIHAKQRANDLGYQYVRLALVPYFSNSSWGGSLEKAIFNHFSADLNNFSAGDIRPINYMEENKLAGIMRGDINTLPGYQRTPTQQLIMDDLIAAALTGVWTPELVDHIAKF